MASARNRSRRPSSQPNVDAAPRDAFPAFADGDVKVVVTGARQYQLHASVLKNNSPILRDLLESVKPAPLTNKLVKAGHSVRYKLMLVNNDDEESRVPFVFAVVPLDANGRPIDGNPDGIGQDLENGKIVHPAVIAFHIVLGAFYNIPIDLGNAQDDGLSHLLAQALHITDIAEYLDCIRIITAPIESTLLATGQHLYRGISTNPCAWLSFAYRVKSKAIFKEALIHAAGQYNTAAVRKDIEEGNMPDEVIEVLHRKGAHIKSSVITAERHLASYYPSILMREATVGRVDRDNIGRANYANDIMMWIALSIFRHWCCDMMASDQTHHAEDMGFALVQAVDRGGDTYLSKQLLQQQFHQRFPMSPKGMACVEHRLAEIKEVVKQWSHPLMRHEAALDIKLYPINFFTFTKVTNSDYVFLENVGDDDDEFDDDDNEASGSPPEIPNYDEDDDEDMDDVESMPTLTDGGSANMSIDQLGPGDLEDDTADPVIEDDDDGRLAGANTLARLRQENFQPVPPPVRRRNLE